MEQDKKFWHCESECKCVTISDSPRNIGNSNCSNRCKRGAFLEETGSFLYLDQSGFDFLHIYFYHPKNIEMLTI
jgi:hypothetical protein